MKPDRQFRWRLDRGPLWGWLVLIFLIGISILSADLLYEQFDRRPALPRVSRYQPDLKEFRRLTQNIRGPRALNRLKIADERDPGVTINSFQLVYGARDDRSTILIDAGLDARLHRELSPRGKFFSKAYERLQTELQRARSIYFTQEYYDHVGGISRSADLYGIRDRIRLTALQARSPHLKASRFPPTVLEAITTIQCDRVCSPAPGLVLFATPGQARGAQWVYLRMADGRELLLVGEKSITHKEIRNLQPRRNFTYWLADRDAEEIAHRLQALHVLQAAYERLKIVPVHDEATLQKYIQAGIIGEGFDYDSPFGAR